MSAPTSGPWYVSNTDDGHVIVGGNGASVTLARVMTVSVPGAYANARLMAAAPTLADTCRKLALLVTALSGFTEATAHAGRALPHIPLDDTLEGARDLLATLPPEEN